MTFLKTLSSGLAAAAVLAAAPASAALITYDVNLNFNPTQTEASPGAGSVGTITGTVTIDTSIPVRDLRIANQTGYDTTDVIGVNLTEATNDGIAAIGGGFGSPTYTSFTFTEYQPVTYIFFGSPISLNTSTATLSGGPGGATYLGLFFQTSASYLDGTLIGPSFQFVFPFPDGRNCSHRELQLDHQRDQVPLRQRHRAGRSGTGDLGDDARGLRRAWFCFSSRGRWAVEAIGAGALGRSLRSSARGPLTRPF